ncbi:cell division cycle and apoptosis regulator protein 1-like isoform X2 [Neocloeon triangulifer]|uniref:cell division cycle and apoptosis regulator protein 1-like isoform X2 n=1 Tax=Neocloeon triangulifer TaxID=2078957 RepID=UPI00286EDD56|nr:cell division cycle and apoptosis regulator protein 1-like isoform X2 [Neocloeon triangulifer]
MSQFSAQANNPPWARTNGQGLPPPLGQHNQMQGAPMMQHTLLNQQVNFQQQQQVYQQSIQNIQQQQQQPPPGLLGQLGDKSKNYSPMPYPFQTTQLGGLAGSIATSAGLQPLHTLQGTIPASPQITQQGSISYPAPRSIRTFTNQPPPLANVITTAPAAAQQNQVTQKNRVFTGVITKLHENFGFIDEDVFFNLSVVSKGLPPVVGERALVDATYNPNMPFKWNATKVQVLPSERQTFGGGGMSGYNAVPPPHFNSTVSGGGGSKMGDGGHGRSDEGRRGDMRRENLRRGSRERERESDRERERERERRTREDRQKEREKERDKDKRSCSSRSPSASSRRRSRSPRAGQASSRSPTRRRARVMPRYVVQIPKISLESSEANMLELKRRYTNLYVPSDFFVSHFSWVDAFPADRPFALKRPSAFHVAHKDVDEIVQNDTVLEPPDADYSFSAKVMLISVPVLDELYRKSCVLAEDMKNSTTKDGEERDGYVHPTRLINFLVGVRGKTKETMAIGGPWSPSLDGPDPDKDPSVLIKTAIRTCKALTGVDLSPCTLWYRFVEIYYHRSETTHKGKVIPSRVETVVLFLPDVWSCLPTRLEWESLQLSYKKQLGRKLQKPSSATAEAPVEVKAATNAAEEAAENQKDEEKMEVDAEKKPEPTHFTELDVKVMKVSEMRLELEARTLSPKGLKSQLIARLTKALKTEQETEEADAKAAAEKASDAEEVLAEPLSEDAAENNKEEADKKKSSEDKEKQVRYERRFALPENPHIIVHPSKTAKSGKFDCTVMSLSLLLDYRQEDTKEHSFEVSLFAELFNEMLRRDFGFRIFRAFSEIPEKPNEEEKDKEAKKPEKKEDEGKQDEKSESKEAADEEDPKEDGHSSSSAGSKKKESKDAKEPKEKEAKKIKMVTVDPGLLLAFVYFDQSHCGYILHKDLEEIIYTLGLNLSRAQVKRLIQKVVQRDAFNYRKLTDKSESEAKSVIETEEDPEQSRELAEGNHKLLPIFSGEPRRAQAGNNGGQTASSNSEVVIYKGCVVDVGKLMQQLERIEKSRVDSEEKIVVLEKQLAQAKLCASTSTESANKLTEQLSDCKAKLSETEDHLKKEKDSNSRYLTALNKVTDIVSVATTTIKEEKVKK